MRVTTAVVAGCSFVATAATIANAFFINRQFYSSVVYITKSNASMAVIYFQIVMIVYMFFQLLKMIFFGELRQAETEHLWERTWHAILETCLAFTVFRDDFSPMFVMNFGLLLFVKCFHWLAEDRVDIMERSPVIPLRFHMRIISLLALLASINSYLISHAYFSIMTKGPSSQLVFGFEYAILMTLLIHIAVKYILHMHDLQTGGVWEAKQVYLLYTELITSFVRCVLYGMFAILMIRLHTFPLFFIRPFYLSLRSLHKAINDVILSRRAITAMNTMFPVVTAEELANMDTTCIICRDEMTHESQPKKLPCFHVFHAHCLRSWFQRQQTCPTCRTDILGRNNPNREARAQPAPAAGAGAGGAGAGAAQAQGQVPFFAFAAHQFAAAPFQQPPNPAAGNGPTPPPPAGWNMQQNHGFANPFPGLPFMPAMGLMPPLPPPMPPMPSLPRAALHELSDEELRALEGSTRDAVISRLRMLQDVSSLLDAVDMMMRQYCHVSGFPEFPPTNPAEPTPPSPSSTAATQSTSVNSSPSQPAAAEPSSEVETPTTSQPSEETTTTSSSSPSHNTSLGSPGSSSEEQNIVRELRRRRFEQQQQQENGSP